MHSMLLHRSLEIDNKSFSKISHAVCLEILNLKIIHLKITNLGRNLIIVNLLKLREN